MKPDEMDFEPPGHLSDRAKTLWRAVVPGKARSLGRLAFLQSALEALDRADAARLAVERDGMTTTTKATGAVHMNPLVKVEREARNQFLKAWDMLGLKWDQAIDGGAWRPTKFLD